MSRHRRARAVWRPILLAFLLSLFGTSLVRAFAEEPLTFRDPHTGQTTQEEISTVHDDLTYALALAAGFSISDSIKLQLYNQLVDSEVLGNGLPITYTNCAGSFYPTPRPSVVCTTGGPYVPVAWPMWDSMQNPATCATSRFGPYSPFFHFPRQTPQELGALHDWGWGLTNALMGYEAYAWGGASVMEARCTYTRSAVIATGLEAGSLEAFATYLHSLADSYSHRDCIAARDALGAKWATHTLSGVYPCDYNPYHHTNDDAHGREFGTRSMTDSQRLDAAILDVYRELSARSVQREGKYQPLSLETRLAITGSPTLSATLYAFVHGVDFDQAAERRRLVDQMLPAILALRQPWYRAFLPLGMQRSRDVAVGTRRDAAR